MRQLDYSNKQKDGLYVRCVCGLPWSAHTASIPMAANGCRLYQPAIGKPEKLSDVLDRLRGPWKYHEDADVIVRSVNSALKSYSETFGHSFKEDEAEAEFAANHVHTIRRNVLNRIAAHGARDFPRECCGFILGDDVSDVRPIKNTNKLGYGSYTMDYPQQIAVLKEVENGKQLKVVYHSHPNMGAFFSGIDRAAATSIDPEQPDWPETVWIVMSIRDGKRFPKWDAPINVRETQRLLGAETPTDLRRPHLADARAYLWNPAIKDFSEITLKVVE